MKQKYFFMIVLGFFIFLLFSKGFEYFKQSDICTANLTDREYLEHMIPHHQVAIDISLILQKKTKSIFMQEILRKLIWIQKTEIKLMKVMLDSLPQKISSDDNMKNIYIKTISDYINPNKIELTNVYCDPHFFDPKGHHTHMMEHININDQTYINHMIPHHQVAVDMSKILLKNTKNDQMISFAYRIIKSQQAEIIILNDFLKSSYVNKSNLIL